MDYREIMLHCTKVNKDYMRLPAGKVTGLEVMTSLYNRISDQSLQCAREWHNERPCPRHEPAVDAFWWAAVAWTDGFGLSVGVDPVEWGRVFVAPHEQFANYLKPNMLQPPIEAVEGHPAHQNITLTRLWMELTIKLTADWGLIHHLKDRRALVEAHRLDTELKNPEGPVYKAYLHSDMLFFKALFRGIPFSDKTKSQLFAWIQRAEEVL